MYKIEKIFFLFLEPFEVGYVQTIYTVYENESSVEVCVNLTKPVLGEFEDLGDEMVFMDTIDFPRSMYIPANSTPASELLGL